MVNENEVSEPLPIERTMKVLNLTEGLGMDGNKHQGIPSTFVESNSKQQQLDKSS